MVVNKFVLIERELKNFYQGKTFQKDGDFYASLTKDISEAKIYTSQGKAYVGVNSINSKCGNTYFDVVPLEYANKSYDEINSIIGLNNNEKNTNNHTKIISIEELLKKETIHCDDCECVYCGHIFIGADAVNYDISCSFVTCPECHKEMYVDMVVSYRCRPIEE